MFGATPLVYYLTTIPIPLIDDDDELADEPLFQAHAKHFGYILQEAERILGPHEFSTPVLEDVGVVPFSTVRQFLASHIIEETKPAQQQNPNNNNNANNKNNNNNKTTLRPAPQQQARISVSSSSNLGDLEL